MYITSSKLNYYRKFINYIHNKNYINYIIKFKSMSKKVISFSNITPNK